MQERSNLWKEIASTANFRTETIAEIEGKTYTSISAPVITRALMIDALSVGNCASATLEMSVLTADKIPQSAKITIKKRLSDGSRFSEWIPAGTFFLSRRQNDRVTKHLITLTCYDAMRKTEDPYPLYEGDESNWPKTMRDVISEIAIQIGVNVDERTWEHIHDGPDYIVPYPLGMKMKKVLGHIAGAHGGNFHITQDNRLRFVPLLSGTNAETSTDRLNILAITGSIKTGESVTITGVSIANGSETFTAGDQTGYVMTIPKNPYSTQAIADDLFAQLGGLVYAPFIIENGLYDPAAELGDYVVSRNDVRSVLYTETARLNLAYRANISSPYKEEVTDEYPYKSKTDELDDELQELVTIVADKASIDDLYALRAQIDNLSVSDIKTGIIHSNDYQYAPYPLVYPSKATFPSNELYPSNGEYVLRGFAIDFGAGVIYGAFYSEQIIALQEITSAQANRLEELSAELDGVQERLSAISQKDQQQDSAITNLQSLTETQGTIIATHTTDIASLKNSASEHDETLTEHGATISGLQADVSDLSGRITALSAEIQNVSTDLMTAINAVKNTLTYPKSPIT